MRIIIATESGLAVDQITEPEIGQVQKPAVLEKLMRRIVVDIRAARLLEQSTPSTRIPREGLWEAFSG